MRYFFKALIFALSLLCLTENAYANQGKSQAGVLATEPASISSEWSNSIDGSNDGTNNLSNNLNITTEPIGLVRQSQKCQKLDPFEFIQNPGAILEECQKKTSEAPPQAATERIKYFEVPGLESGINVQVTQF